jgi:hypothetical protein
VPDNLLVVSDQNVSIAIVAQRIIPSAQRQHCAPIWGTLQSFLVRRRSPAPSAWPFLEGVIDISNSSADAAAPAALTASEPAAAPHRPGCCGLEPACAHSGGGREEERFDAGWLSPGAPEAGRIAWKHGRYSAEAAARRRSIAELICAVRFIYRKVRRGDALHLIAGRAAVFNFTLN